MTADTDSLREALADLLQQKVAALVPRKAVGYHVGAAANITDAVLRVLDQEGWVSPFDVRSPHCAICSACRGDQPCRTDCYICWPELAAARAALREAGQYEWSGRQDPVTGVPLYRKITEDT
jgi:hypothetical protein